jgi:hypothetical protein
MPTRRSPLPPQALVSDGCFLRALLSPTNKSIAFAIGSMPTSSHVTRPNIGAAHKFGPKTREEQKDS